MYQNIKSCQNILFIAIKAFEPHPIGPTHYLFPRGHESSEYSQITQQFLLSLGIPITLLQLSQRKNGKH